MSAVPSGVDGSYAIAVLAKEPVPGRVKTRLCPPYTPDEAARLAAAALLDTLDAVAAAGAARRFLVLDGDPSGLQRPWLETFPQRGEGLGERIDNALADVAAATRLPVLLVGMDTPQLTPGDLDAAGAALGGTDAVLGPASDGGFWSLGIRSPGAELCRGVPMSSADTGGRQLARLQALGLRTTLLPELTDVDDEATARTVARECPATRFALLVHALDRVVA